MRQKLELKQFRTDEFTTKLDDLADLVGKNILYMSMSQTKSLKLNIHFTTLIFNFLSIFTDKSEITPANVKPIGEDKKTKGSIQNIKDVPYLVFIPHNKKKLIELLQVGAIQGLFGNYVSVLDRAEGIYALQLAAKPLDEGSPQKEEIIPCLEFMVHVAHEMGEYRFYADAETLLKPLKKFLGRVDAKIDQELGRSIPRPPDLPYQTTVERRDADDLLKMIRDGNALTRGVGSCLHGSETHWKFEVGDLQTPWHEYYRTPNPKEELSIDRRIKMNLTKAVCTPGGAVTFDYTDPNNYIEKDQSRHKRGQAKDKDWKWTKKRSLSVLPKNGRMANFKNAHAESYDVALFYDRSACKAVPGNSFSSDAYTFYQWKYLVQVDGSIDFETSDKHLPKWRPSAETVVSEMNAACDQHPGGLVVYPELPYLLTKDALVGLYLFNDDLPTKLIAIQKKLYLRRYLGLDLPMVILGNQQPVIYTQEAQKANVVSYMAECCIGGQYGWFNDLSRNELYLYAQEIGCDLSVLSQAQKDAFVTWKKDPINSIRFTEDTRKSRTKTTTTTTTTSTTTTKTSSNSSNSSPSTNANSSATHTNASSSASTNSATSTTTQLTANTNSNTAFNTATPALDSRLQAMTNTNEFKTMFDGLGCRFKDTNTDTTTNTTTSMTQAGWRLAIINNNVTLQFEDEPHRPLALNILKLVSGTYIPNSMFVCDEGTTYNICFSSPSDCKKVFGLMIGQDAPIEADESNNQKTTTKSEKIANAIHAELAVLAQTSTSDKNFLFDIAIDVNTALKNSNEASLSKCLAHAEKVDGTPSLGKKLAGLLFMLVGVLAIAAGVVLSVATTAATFGLAAPLSVPIGAAIASSGAVLAGGGAFLFFNGCRKGLSNDLVNVVQLAKTHSLS
jgi:hypothetical protein